MSDKTRWPRADAVGVATEVVASLEPFCARIMVCGSVRRLKPMVGDVEIVYVPRLKPGIEGGDMFTAPPPVNVADQALAFMLERGFLAKRLNTIGRPAWGECNKLAVHVESGMPVDLFATTAAAWWNYVVCRTGGADSNTEIASRARQMGWQWHPYGIGFELRRGAARGAWVACWSEREVFEFVGLKYREPEERR